MGASTHRAPPPSTSTTKDKKPITISSTSSTISTTNVEIVSPTEPNPSTVPCKFFRLGACTLGTHCPFSHSREVGELTVCKYFMKGSCKFGNSCALSHAVPTQAVIQFGRTVFTAAAPTNGTSATSPLSPTSPTSPLSTVKQPSSSADHYKHARSHHHHNHHSHSHSHHHNHHHSRPPTATTAASANSQQVSSKKKVVFQSAPIVENAWTKGSPFSKKLAGEEDEVDEDGNENGVTEEEKNDGGVEEEDENRVEIEESVEEEKIEMDVPSTPQQIQQDPEPSMADNVSFLGSTGTTHATTDDVKPTATASSLFDSPISTTVDPTTSSSNPATPAMSGLFDSAFNGNSLLFSPGSLKFDPFGATSSSSGEAKGNTMINGTSSTTNTSNEVVSKDDDVKKLLGLNISDLLVGGPIGSATGSSNNVTSPSNMNATANNGGNTWGNETTSSLWSSIPQPLPTPEHTINGNPLNSPLSPFSDSRIINSPSSLVSERHNASSSSLDDVNMRMMNMGLNMPSQQQQQQQQQQGSLSPASSSQGELMPSPQHASTPFTSSNDSLPSVMSNDPNSVALMMGSLPQHPSVLGGLVSAGNSPNTASPEQQLLEQQLLIQQLLLQQQQMIPPMNFAQQPNPAQQHQHQHQQQQQQLDPNALQFIYQIQQQQQQQQQMGEFMNPNMDLGMNMGLNNMGMNMNMNMGMNMGMNMNMGMMNEFGTGWIDLGRRNEDLCPFSIHGNCRYGDSCRLPHGGQCHYCSKYVLHPSWTLLEKQEHLIQCQNRLIENSLMNEHHFEQQRSHDHGHHSIRHTTSHLIDDDEDDEDNELEELDGGNLICTLCGEIVLKKLPGGVTNGIQTGGLLATESKGKGAKEYNRFGLLNCNHVYCYPCIRQWRQNFTTKDNQIIRSCPLCETATHFIVPSYIWPFDNTELKDNLIREHKLKLSKIPCKFYKPYTSNSCPFGNQCFYRHVSPYSSTSSTIMSSADVLETKALMASSGSAHSMARVMVDENEQVRIVKGVSLADFFDKLV